MKRLLLLVLLLTIPACADLGSGDVAADPSLALPDFHAVQPVTYRFEEADYEPRTDGDTRDEVRAAIHYMRDDYLPTLGMVEDQVAPDIVFNTVLVASSDTVHYGRAWHEDGACLVELNEQTLRDVPLLWDRAIRATYVHEVGHCLGLVVTPTESAQRTEGDTLNHCRHFECSMSVRGLGSDFEQLLGWLSNVISDEPTYCRYCEWYLRGRIDEAKQIDEEVF